MLMDSGTMGLSMGLQAVTPAGLETFGLAEGPTILTPNFAWFYETSSGTALQGFVGKNLRTRPGWSESLERDIRYGLALQTPCPWVDRSPTRSVHLFVEALGRVHYDTGPTQRTPGKWDI